MSDLRKATFSYSAVSMTWFPVKVAIARGFFGQEGIEPELIQMNGNVATVALANGHIDFSLNISPVLNGAMQGLGTKLVAALNSRPLFSLVVRPEIASATDLKGKIFARKLVRQYPSDSYGKAPAVLGLEKRRVSTAGDGRDARAHRCHGKKYRSRKPHAITEQCPDGKQGLPTARQHR